MQKTKVTMPGYMGKPWEVEGYAMAGLIMHKMGKAWVVSHIATGCRIGLGDKLQKDCKARLQRILGILPDWTADSLDSLAVAYGGDKRQFADAIKAVAY